MVSGKGKCESKIRAEAFLNKLQKPGATASKSAAVWLEKTPCFRHRTVCNASYSKAEKQQNLRRVPRKT